MLSYSETLHDLFSRTADGAKLGLAATRELLAALGEPQRQLPPVVLVAGTNGKGSTSALIAGALRAAGHRVGFFSSPHLLSFRERIRIDDELIGEREVVELYETVRGAAARCSERPSFFECTTAMAVMRFAGAGLEAAVFEVGLGGRLDATNVLDRELAVITPIGLDHTKQLGDTLEAIAAEKAAIIPRGGLAVSAAQAPAALATIRAAAGRLDAELLLAPEARVQDDALLLGGGDLRRELRLSDWPRAAYQRGNLATAALAAEALDRHVLSCPPAAVAAAARGFRWPGRFQWVEAGAADLLVDGGHNPAAVAALLQAVDEEPRARDRPLHLVFSALRDKDAGPMVAALAPRCRSVHLCPLGSRRSRTPEELAALVPAGQLHATAAAALEAATRRARADGGLVLAAGSLFLAADVLAAATGAPRDPPIDG